MNRISRIDISAARDNVLRETLAPIELGHVVVHGAALEIG